MPQTFDPAKFNLLMEEPYKSLFELCRDVQTLRFEDGEYIIRQGEEGMDVYLLLKGAVVVEQTSKEQPAAPPSVLAVIFVEGPTKPCFLGEMAYLGGALRSASIKSSGWTHLLRLLPSHLDAIIENLPALTSVLCRQFANRLGIAADSLRDLQERFVMRTEERFLRDGDVLFSAGDTPDYLYQLVDGMLVKRTDAGEAFLRPGELPEGFVEPQSFMTGTPYPCTVEVRRQAMLVAIPAESRLAFIRSYPQLVANAIARI